MQDYHEIIMENSATPYHDE